MNFLNYEITVQFISYFSEQTFFTGVSGSSPEMDRRFRFKPRKNLETRVPNESYYKLH
jgi:hypothetical protein